MKKEEKTIDDIETKDVQNEATSEISENTDEKNEVNEEISEDDQTVEDENNKKYEELFDKYQRLMAEFENYRKRNEKEKQEMFDMGMVSSITRILPIVDNFERGISQIPEEAKKDAINDGFIKVYDQFIQTLEAMDVHVIEALNKEFDPNLHNAVMHDEDPEKPANVVAEEFQKGYKYKDKVIRYSMVKVLN